MTQMFQENISIIEPDHSFEFQKEIENFCNASGNLSLDNSIHSDKNLQIQQSPTVISSQRNNLVMIDQDQLMELLKAKQILDAQNNQSNGAKQVDTEKIMKQAFGNQLFLTPETVRPFSISSSPSTKASESTQNNNSGQEYKNVVPFSEIKDQKDNKPTNSLFSSSLFSSSAPMNNMKNNSKYSQIYSLNKNLTNNNKLDSRFNKDFIEENGDQSNSQANCSVLGTSAQGRAIGNDLMNIIDCDSSVDSIKQFQEPAKQIVQQQPYFKPTMPTQQYTTFNAASALTNNFQNLNFNDNINNSPDSNEYSQQSSSLTNENSGSSGEFQSIFTHQNQYMQPPAQTVNNIVINNFNIAPTSMNKAAINAPAFKPTSFKPVDQIKSFVPTINKQDMPEEAQIEEQADQDTCSKKQKSLFAFPEGGWECSKCQNYNFKGRDQCHRCKKDKNDEDYLGKPKHMSQAKMTKKQKKLVKAEKEAAVKASEEKNELVKMEFANKWANNTDYRAPKDKKVKQNKIEQSSQSGRNGDWTCQRCMNHNFAFREACNICYMGQLESNKIVQQQLQNQMQFAQPQLQQQQWCQQQVPMQQYNQMNQYQNIGNMVQMQNQFFPSYQQY